MGESKLMTKLVLNVPCPDADFNYWTFTVSTPKEKKKQLIITKTLKKKQYGRPKITSNRLF